MSDSKRILALEPYYGGSHQACIDGWRKRSRHSIDLLTLPPRKWKWRMRGAALAVAERLAASPNDSWDGLFCTDMMNLAEFLAIVRPRFDHIPAVLYLHENQLSYPLQPEEELDYHYGLTNFLSIVAADRTVFNSQYNRSDFFDRIREILARMPDHRPTPEAIDRLEASSQVLEPAVDLVSLDAPRTRDDGPPIVLWNHRWERDKRPDLLMDALQELIQRGIHFRVVICGQAFRDTPACFAEAEERLGERLIHIGAAPTRRSYCELLSRSDIIVSTAEQEFFGISVVEAMYAGAYPVLPNRLNYPNLVPEQECDRALYEPGELPRALEFTIKAATTYGLPNLRSFAAHFDWAWMLRGYDALFDLERDRGNRATQSAPPLHSSRTDFVA